MITLYDYELSADCYAVRLLLGVLGLHYARRELDVHPDREHESAWFLALNPLGEVPVLEDAGLVLREGPAILGYLAARYDRGGRWSPQEAGAAARVQDWLGFAARLSASAGAARLHDTIFHDVDIDACRRRAHALLRVLDEHLWFAEAAGANWLCSDLAPTIADLACFPPVILCEEGGISRLPYPAVRRWTDRVKRIADFTPMAGVFMADVPA